MTVALVQDAPKLNRSNMDDVIALIQTSFHQADVLVFCELALNGYMLQDKLYEDAWEIEELEPLARLSKQCAIVIGAAVRDHGKTYNSALYFAHGKLLHRHDKIHLPNYGMFEEARYFFKGSQIEAIDTPSGREVMLVCEDIWRAEAVAHISTLQPDVVYVIANSPARDFRDDGLLIESQWDALLKSLALQGSTYVIFVNRVGFEDGMGFWGGSRVVTPQGEIEHVMPLFESAFSIVTLDRQLHAVKKWLAKKGN